MPSDTPASNPLQRGYVPFSGDAAEFHGWVTLMSSIMYESDLGNVMHGDETAPAALEEDASSAATTAYRKALHKFKEKNGKVFTRLLLATSDCPEGYSSPASQVVQSHGPIGAEKLGDGRGAFAALEAKYRFEGVHRMQQLHDELAAVELTAADKFDPARVIQKLRRIFHELAALGDPIVASRQSHLLMNALPAKPYGTFKSYIECEMMRSGSEGMKFDEIARQVTQFHAKQVRGTILDLDGGSGSHGRALNTVTHGGARGFRKQGGRGGRGSRRGNGGRTGTGSSGSNSNGGGTSGGASAGNAHGARGNERGSQASGGRGKGPDNGRNRKGRCRYCHGSTEHGWHNCPLRLRHEAEDANEQADAHNTRDSTTHAWFTRVETEGDELEDYAIVFGEDTQAQDVLAAAQPEERAGENSQVQKDLADHMQVQMEPAAARPEERAAKDEQVRHAPETALPDGYVVYDPQVLFAHVPAAALPEERAADNTLVQGVPGDTQVQTDPVAAQLEERAASDTLVQDAPVPTLQDARVVYDPQVLDTSAAAVVYDPTAYAYSQVEEAPDTTELVAYSKVFRVTPVVAMPKEHATEEETVHELPEAMPPEVRAVCDSQKTSSATSTEEDPAATSHFQAEEEPNAAERAAYTDVFQVEEMDQVNLLVVGDMVEQVEALAEKGVMGDSLSAPPGLSLSTHCNSRALQQLVNKNTFGVEFKNIETGDGGVGAGGDCMKISQTLSYRPSSDTRLEIVSAEMWGEHPTNPYGDRESAVMFADDASRVRFGYPIKTKEDSDDNEEDKTQAGQNQTQEPQPCWSNGDYASWTVMNLCGKEVFDRGRRSPTLLCW